MQHHDLSTCGRECLEGRIEAGIELGLHYLLFSARHSSQLFPAAIGAGATLAIGIAVVAGVTPDARLSQCGSDLGGNRVAASFEIPAARDIWKYLPAMGRAPELEEDDKPAFVVIFEGGYQAAWVDGQTLREQTVTDVICVVTESGSTNVYYDVSRQGLNLPS